MSAVADSQPSVRIFDTTLRDGEQSPGATLGRAEKLEIARMLELLRVDIIEAGFPVASDGDFDSVKAIAETIRGPVICGLARCHPKDIDRAGNAIKPAARGRIHLFLATSKIHLEHKLRKSEDEIVKLAVESIKHAKTFTDDIEFSPEDASRTDLTFLAEMTQAAIEAGATTINLPDTVGYATPASYGLIFKTMIEKLPIIRERGIILSTHCHDDLGMAVANSLAGVENGARQVECTINGIGERAGNAAVEEIVMALRTRADYYKTDTKIDATKLYPASRLLCALTGLVVQRNKAIVGQNAFAHESGIHQDGVLKHRETYEIMNPTDVGISKNELVLGKHSGRAALRDRAVTLGFALDDAALDKVFVEFKKLADKKKEVFDEDIEALIDAHLEQPRDAYELVALQVTAGSSAVPTATVTIRDGATGEPQTDASVGDGPVDAIYSTIARLTGIKPTLVDFRLRSITGGKEAQGEVHVDLEQDGIKVAGRGVSTDILEAAAKAYLAAINRLRTQAGRRREVTQHSGV